MTTSVGEDFPKQQKRCRELLEQYKAIGPAGQFAYSMISQALGRAEQAAISGDVVAILRSYQELRGFE